MIKTGIDVHSKDSYVFQAAKRSLQRLRRLNNIKVTISLGNGNTSSFRFASRTLVLQDNAFAENTRPTKAAQTFVHKCEIKA